MSDLFTLTCDKIPSLTFVGFRGKEQISRPYEFELFFTVPMGTAVRDAVGERATLTGARDSVSEPVVFHGIIAQVALVHQPGSRKRNDQDRALYRALLVPRLWLLRQFWRSFVFTGKNVKQFLTDTLEAGGLVSSEYRFDIDDGSHPTEEFVAQYRESYLDFFHRWLEREGLYYYFEHKADASNEVLVIVEDKSHNEAFPGGGKVTYFPVLGDDASALEGLHQLEADIHWLPKTVTLADYDYSNPSVAVTADSQVTERGIGTIRDYGYRMFVDGDAKRLAKVKAQSIGCRETVLRATGTHLGPRAGYRLSIDDRPDDLEEDWLAIEVEHTGTMRVLTGETARLTGLSEKHVYGMKIVAIPSSVQYRAPQTTEWPRIYGFENALVMGDAESPYAQIDADGRYLVRFEFDTSDIPDGKISTRVRMLQPHGGSTEGFHFPLRKGTEVMIAFLGGDPDRPFIAGVVPNAHKPSVVGKRNHTQNIIRTGSNNQIVLEDEQGKEFIFMHTPNQKTGIYMGNPAGAHSSVYTGETEHASSVACDGPANAAPAGKPTPPGAQSTINTTAAFHVHTEQNQVFEITGSSTTLIDTGPENTYVGGDVFHGYKGIYGFLVGGNADEHYYSNETITVDGNRVETVTGTVTETYGPQHTEVKGNAQLEVRGAFFHKVDAKNDDNYGEWGTWVKGPWKSQTSDWTHKSPNVDWTIGSNVSWTVGTKVEIKAGANVEITAPSVKCEATGFLKHYLSVKNETYLEKGALGAIKFDEAGFYQAAYGMKMDTAGIKLENEGAKKATYGMIQRAWGARQVLAGLSLKEIAAEIFNGAFKKT